jgi:uncharacterized Zn-finger protein
MYDFTKNLFCKVCEKETDHTFVYLDLSGSQVFFTYSCGVCVLKYGTKSKSHVDTMSIERWKKQEFKRE